jgi:hypothetical protein
MSPHWLLCHHQLLLLLGLPACQLFQMQQQQQQQQYDCSWS